MESIEYYKSLISDEEVIKALVKESKSREGEPFKEKTRVRPNLNFFQRTVTNLVSSNRRITTIPEFIPKERNRNVRKVKTPHTLMREILMTNKINFVKAEESKTPEDVKKSSLADVVDENRSSKRLNECFNKSDSPPKLSTKSGSIHFNLNFDKHKFDKTSSSNKSKDFSKYEKREPSTSSDSSDASIISISSTDSLSSSSLSSSESDDVITISDSDGDSTSNKPRQKKNEKICRRKCKRRIQKRRKKRKDV